MAENNEIDIIRLGFPENIRSRVGMYIGSTENASVILREAIDNSVDELYGYDKTNRIYISTEGDWKIVADNGRGIPIIWDEKEGMTKTQLACTGIHTGSKFNKTDVAIGLNGVGISATSATSNKFVILSKITKDNFDKSISEVKDAWNKTPNVTDLYYYIGLEKGIKVSEGAIRRSELQINEWFNGIEFPEGMSTVTAFIPDDTIYQSTECKIPKKNLSYALTILNKVYKRQVSIEVNKTLIQDEFVPYQFEFFREVEAKNWKGEFKKVKFYVNFECDRNMSVSEFSGSVNSLVVDRGTHVEAAKTAFVDALKARYGLNYNTCLSGLRMNVIALAAEVDFSSQTKERCTKLEGLPLADLAKGIQRDFMTVMKRNQDYFDDHVARLTEYISSLTKISTINKIKNAIGTVASGGSRVRSKVPKSVRDASSNKREDTELYIVEGRSAAGPIINTRDPKTQAVFELRGIPMNSVDKNLDEILDNEEFKALISAIGVGVNEYHDMNLARYGKILIAADADSDGRKLAALVLGFFVQKMTFMIKKGIVYIVESPIYIQGDRYFYPGDSLESLDRNKPFTRVKGLGELREDQAYHIITNPKTRRLTQITMDNADDAINILSKTSARKELMINEKVVTDPYNLGIWD